MEPSQMVELTRQTLGWTRRDLARAAGVSESTISRIANKKLDPTWSVLRRVLAAGGRKVGGDGVESLNDSTVVESAYKVLDPNQAPDLNDPWVQGWVRAGFVDAVTGKAKRVEPIVVVTGTASRVAARMTGSVSLPAGMNLEAAVAQVLELDADAVVSGIEALKDKLPSTGDPLIYTNATPQQIQAKLGARSNTPGRRLRIATREVSIPRNPKRPNMAAPAFALIDAFASGGRTSDRADAFIPRIERELLGGTP